MHELPVTEGILTLAIDTARQAGAGRIIAIDLVVGDLSSIVDDSVQFYFDLLSPGTPAEGAALRIRRAPAELICSDCGARHAVRAPLLPACPSCGGPRVHVGGGREFYVESIEVCDEASGGAGDPERERPGGG